MELPEFLVPVISELANAEGFADGFSVTTEKATTIGDGYSGTLLRVTVKGDRKISDEAISSISSFSCIVKMPPDNPEIREQFKSLVVFGNEAKFYTKFYPMLVQFQHDREITDLEEGFFAVPKCYKVIADAENGNHAIILEDLKTSNFQLFNRNETINMAHVSIFIKRLAQYHALFFAMRDQQPEMFEEIRKSEGLQMTDLPMMHGMFLAAIDKAIAAFGSIEEFKNEKLERLKNEIIKTFELCMKPENFEPFGVLMHGDCWNNNMMYSYDAEVNPNGIRIIDFQLIRYGSPICDLVYFLFTSTNGELRDDHYEDILRMYHTNLCEFINRLGSDGEKLFPWLTFKRQLRKFGRYGLLMSLFLIPTVTAHVEDIPDIDRIAQAFAEQKSEVFSFFQNLNESSEKAYRKRMLDVVRDIIRLGYY